MILSNIRESEFVISSINLIISSDFSNPTSVIFIFRFWSIKMESTSLWGIDINCVRWSGSAISFWLKWVQSIWTISLDINFNSWLNVINSESVAWKVSSTLAFSINFNISYKTISIIRWDKESLARSGINHSQSWWRNFNIIISLSINVINNSIFIREVNIYVDWRWNLSINGISSRIIWSRN